METILHAEQADWFGAIGNPQAGNVARLHLCHRSCSKGGGCYAFGAGCHDICRRAAEEIGGEAALQVSIREDADECASIIGEADTTEVAGGERDKNIGH